MKIIQINASYKPAYIYGGPTMSVSKLSEELAKTDIELEVFTTTANGKTELSVDVATPQIVDGVKVNYFKRLTKDHTHFSSTLLWSLHKTIKKGKKENLIIHIHAWWNLVSMLSCFVAKWHKVTILLSPRGMLTNYTLGNRNSLSKSILHKILGKNLLAYCHIHATSKKEQDDVLQNFRVKSINVIPNFVRLAPNKNIAKTNHTTYQLLFLSRIEQKKGLELLFSSLKALDINWNLTIAGSGEESYLKQLNSLAEQYQINQHITWLGHVNNNDKFDLIAKHDLLILSSYNENFANVVIESLSVGTPVLVSKEVGLADYVKEKDLGWIADLTPEDLSLKLKASYLEKGKREKIRNTAQAIIENDFNEQKLIQKYIDCYHTLIRLK